MAQWFSRLEFKTLWKSYDDGGISIQNVANQVSAALEAHVNYSNDPELQGIAEEFKEFSSDTSADADDFDDILDRLYDWADGARCWIATF